MANLCKILDFFETKECKLYRDKNDVVKGLVFIMFDELDDLVEIAGLDCETRLKVTLCEGYVAVEFEDFMWITDTELEDYKELFDDWDYYFGKGGSGE